MQRITTYEKFVTLPEGTERRRTHTFTHVAGKDTVVREYHLVLPDGTTYTYDLREQQEGETAEEYKAYRDEHTAQYPDAVKAFHAAVKDYRESLAN